MSYSNVMLDLETLSMEPDAAIVTIAAVKFNMHNDKVDTFLININPRDCHRLGMRIDTNTIDWWKKQKPEAMRAWMKDGKTVQEAVDAFTDWLGDAKDMNVWAQGIDFDIIILRNALRIGEKPVTWNYWNQCDSRTVFKVSGFDYKKAARVGLYHSAIDDCLTQIKWLKMVNAGESA